jgi:hypothetical protein
MVPAERAVQARKSGKDFRNERHEGQDDNDEKD